MATPNPPAVDWAAATARLVDVHRALVRIDTSNPPGNETPAAQYLAALLGAAGIPSHVLGREPDRCSVVARVPGSGLKRPLLLLSHLDVVTAEPRHWTYPPFDAVVHDGLVWGRGAVDCKALVAQEALLLLLLQESGLALDRDVILAATADEESPIPTGLPWLLAHHPHLLDAEYCLNEGAGDGVRLGDRSFYPCQVAEKGLSPLRLSATGRPGHASVPHGPNAIVLLARAIDRLAATPLPFHPQPAAGAFLRALDDYLPLYQAQEPGLVDCLQRNTLAPTLLRAGTRLNIIPSLAEAHFDCRVLPGQTEAGVLAEVRAVLGDLPVQAEFLSFRAGAETAYDDELYHLIAAVLPRHDPEGVVIPFLAPYTTDSYYTLRHGIATYGFAPLRPEPGIDYAALPHAHDERISIANLAFGARVLYDVVVGLCAAQNS